MRSYGIDKNKWVVIGGHIFTYINTPFCFGKGLSEKKKEEKNDDDDEQQQ